MTKKILSTGATDGIGLETAKRLYSEGHTLLLHGRNAEKLEATERGLADSTGAGLIYTYKADLSRLAEVESLAKAITKRGFRDCRKKFVYRRRCACPCRSLRGLR